MSDIGIRYIFVSAARMKYGFQEYRPLESGAPVIYKTETISGTVKGVNCSGWHAFEDVTEDYGTSYSWDNNSPEVTDNGAPILSPSASLPSSFSISGYKYTASANSGGYLDYREPPIWRTWEARIYDVPPVPPWAVSPPNRPLWIAAPWTQPGWTGLPLVSETDTVRTWSDGIDTVTATLSDKILTTDISSAVTSIMGLTWPVNEDGLFYNVQSGPIVEMQEPIDSHFRVMAYDFLAPDETLIMQKKCKCFFMMDPALGSAGSVTKITTDLATGAKTTSSVSLSFDENGYSAWMDFAADPGTSVAFVGI